jgi:GNAT superfamily N-acetyltransferase
MTGEAQDHQQCGAELRRVKFDDLEADPAWNGLVEEYASECSICGMPPCNYRGDMYRTLEEAGVLQMIGAYLNGALVGFCFLIVTMSPHYGVPICTTESIFVARASRSTGIGIRLIREVERFAQERGAAAMLIAAPSGGSMERLMPHIGYRHTNTVFFKAIDT